MIFRLCLVVLALFSARCNSEIDTVNGCAPRDYKLEAENVFAKLDESVDPCENFYLFACGGFINDSIIPDDESSINVETFLEEQLNTELSEILNSSVANGDITPIVYSKKLYHACMNQGS